MRHLGLRPTWKAMFFPFTLVPIFLIGSALGMVVAVITVVIHDINRIVSMGLGFLMFLTPIVYGPKFDNEIIQQVIKWNPMTYLIGSPRDIILYGRIDNLNAYLFSSLFAAVPFLAFLAVVLFVGTQGGRKTVMNADTVVRVEGLSKKFSRNLRRSMYYGAIDVIKSMLSIRTQTEVLRPDEFWAVNDVSFELKKGKSLGVIGANGCGKSTLLRLLNGIYTPDHGRIELQGRIGALISLGAGFHPLMTGRENIYLNGAILGLTKQQLDQTLRRDRRFC